MYEELYIINGSNKLKLDLSTPSGITLNYKSNVFGDLSKITCSYSYTFKLPMTVNNRRVLDSADDIRSHSNMIRRRLKCEYIQNGIPLFRNANIYIDSVETHFNAVMTWGVVDGLSTIKDNDESIQLLSNGISALFGDTNALITEYDNTADVLRPLYNAGLKYVTASGHKDNYDTYSVFPLPVVPVLRIINLINQKYGTKFNFGEKTIYDSTSGWQLGTGSEIIDKGVIPLINAVNSTKSFAKLNFSIIVNTNGLATPATSYGSFQSDIITIDKDASGKIVSITNNTSNTIQVELDGYICAKFFHTPNYYDDQGQIVLTSGNRENLIPTFVVKNGTNTDALAKCDGEYEFNNSCWKFSFTKKRGNDRLKFTIPVGGVIHFGFECDTNGFLTSEIIESETFEFNYSYTPEDIDLSKSTTTAGSYQIDVMSNLPDISCMTFLKALYFMIGAFPSVDNNGNIFPLYYSTIENNVKNGIAHDWSKKLSNDSVGLPSKISYTVSGFAQNNYYLLKNDTLENESSKDEEEDVYAIGIGCIPVNNETLDKSKTIIQVPFYGAYLKNNKKPLNPAGIIKFWYINDEGKAETKEAKPHIGIIKELPKSGTNTVWMGMSIWNGFNYIHEDDNYSYLSKIISNPAIIIENFILNEFDLENIDYSVPIYLQKYNAYFAIVSITRDSKGVCKCELIKLP